MILLLSTLGVSLAEIKDYLKNKGNLSDLFNDKKNFIQREIEELQFSLNNIEQYLSNLKHNGTLVNPEVKHIATFSIYYIEKIGSYAKIGSYCQELGKMFADKGKNFTTLSIFEDQGYRPKESRIKICAFAHKDMVVKDEYKDTVKQMTFTPGKVVTYTYRGSGDMLSLFWKQLEKYCRLKGYKVRTGIPDYEVYWNIDANPIKQKFEIFLPIY
jgi:effector-binding domain-containing protein